MLLDWIREKTKFGLNNQAIDYDEFDIGFDFALSFEMVDQLSGPIINVPDIRTHADADTMEPVLDEHELALR
ncbi:hypothetical protein [Methylobacter luteus]|uniref:hypothetical protein n=1 Tax=Methylobacter luteus TaxID=415 RepID=UPI00040C41D2|nr:hypothetical protein [Methylobacter luteus]